MRCPDCNKFATYDDGTEPEVDIDIQADEKETEAEGEGKSTKQNFSLSGSVRVVLTHDECGTELKESSFDIDHTGEFEHKADCKAEGELRVECDNASLTSSSRRKVKQSKKEGGGYKEVPGGGRYATTYYGYEATAEVTCSACDATATVELSDETSASSMDELV